MSIQARAVAFIAGILLALPALAEEIPGTGFSIHLESAQIVGTGRSINIHRLPIVNLGNGAVTDYDVTLNLTLDPNGNVLFENISAITASLPLNFENFLPGTYVGTKRKTYLLSGPSAVGDIRTAWSLVCVSDHCPHTMSWTTGAAVGHPQVGPRPIAPELPPGYSYGVMGQEQCCGYDFDGYRTASIVGAQQIGDSLTVSRFTDSGNDLAAPIASVTLVRQE